MTIRSTSCCHSYELQEAIEPSGACGQIGGYAISVEGQNHRLYMALMRCGGPTDFFPHDFENLADLERGLAWRAASSVDEELQRYRAEIEALRPKVEWMEQNQVELNDWQLLFRICGVYDIDLDWGGAADSLWLFARISDLAAGNFGNVAAAIVP